MDHVTLPRGTIVLADDGRLRSSESSGVASDIVALLLSGDAVIPATSSVGQIRTVRAARPDRTWTAPEAGRWHEEATAVDQTHRSIIVRGPQPSVIVKLIGEWGGAQRAVRLLEMLAVADNDDSPALLGHLEWQHPRRGRSAIAIATRYVESSTDGWTWAVRDVLAYVRHRGEAPTWPAQVGALTARVHSVLSRTQRAPGPGGDVWKREAQAHVTAAVALATGATAQRLHNRVPLLRDAINSISDSPADVFAGHGDLHVGQILRDDNKYWLIDFDGDPQLPASIRDRPEPAARDVAHLLVSIDQVACVAQRYSGGPDPRYPDWAESARAQLLASYRRGLADAGVSDLLDERVLPGFEADQMVRELIYAARQLPRWTYAGDGTLTARFPRHSEWEEDPWTPPPPTTASATQAESARTRQQSPSSSQSNE